MTGLQWVALIALPVAVCGVLFFVFEALLDRRRP